MTIREEIIDELSKDAALLMVPCDPKEIKEPMICRGKCPSKDFVFRCLHFHTHDMTEDCKTECGDFVCRPPSKEEFGYFWPEWVRNEDLDYWKQTQKPPVINKEVTL
jgi:hypothetical protein